ncbi:MAG: hypothetical protein ACOYBB_00805 [Blautia sp.]
MISCKKCYEISIVRRNDNAAKKSKIYIGKIDNNKFELIQILIRIKRGAE